MKIPKIIHLMWFGGERPKYFDYFINEIKRINHDYHVFEWSENNINFELKNKQLFENTTNYGAKSDILRFEVLYEYGGIYMDLDFLQIKKFDDLLNYDFFAGTHDLAPNELWPCVVGATPKHEICEEFLLGLSETSPIGRHEIDRVMNEVSVHYFTKVFNKKTWDCNYKIFVGSEFYPFPLEDRIMIRNFTEQDINHIRSFATENTYCIHFHTTTWL